MTKQPGPTADQQAAHYFLSELRTRIATQTLPYQHGVEERALENLFEVFARNTPKLVEDLVPNLLSLGEVLRVLRNMLRESVSIRDLRTILEGLIELAPATRDPEQLTEMIRQRLSRQITGA